MGFGNLNRVLKRSVFIDTTFSTIVYDNETTDLQKDLSWHGVNTRLTIYIEELPAGVASGRQWDVEFEKEKFRSRIKYNNPTEKLAPGATKTWRYLWIDNREPMRCLRDKLSKLVNKRPLSTAFTA